MKTFKQLLEDIEITDNTGKAYSFAKEYIDTYKDSFRPVPDIITKGGNTRKFIQAVWSSHELGLLADNGLQNNI